jgi:hypothetical protein
MYNLHKPLLVNLWAFCRLLCLHIFLQSKSTLLKVICHLLQWQILELFYKPNLQPQLDKLHRLLLHTCTNFEGSTFTDLSTVIIYTPKSFITLTHVANITKYFTNLSTTMVGYIVGQYCILLYILPAAMLTNFSTVVI